MKLNSRAKHLQATPALRTAAAANYAEARGAESRSDFIHKLRIVLKELNETSVWL
jgi:four helix bundle protein